MAVMKRELLERLRELEEFGKSNDAAASDRSRKMLNITHDTGIFLSILIQTGRCKNVLEIGTSNGYSTLWLADAVGRDGRVTTVERAAHKISMAASNFRAAGLEGRIRQVEDEAGHFIELGDGGAYDFIFLDSDRGQYATWWPVLHRILAPGRLLVVDNAISHAHELEGFTKAIAATSDCMSSLVPIGNGELVILKEDPSGRLLPGQ